MAVIFGIFVVADICLFGWLMTDSLSKRELRRVLTEEVKGAESLAEHLGEGFGAISEATDPYTAVVRNQRIEAYVNSVLLQRELLRKIEIYDQEGRLVYRESRSGLTAGEQKDLLVAEDISELPGFYETTTETEDRFDMEERTFPVEGLGEIKIGISRELATRRAETLALELRRQVGLVGAVTLVILLSGFLVMWRLIQRGQRLEVKAAAAEKMAYIGTLAAGLAHEIRNPLNSLNLNMQMMEEELLGQESSSGSSKRLLTITQSELGRLEGLVTEFLAYARPKELKYQKIPPLELLEHLKLIINAEAKVANVVITVEDETDGSPWLLDPDQMNQLLLNLAKNALAAIEDANRDPGTLKLRAALRGESLSLEVEDNGSGIAAEDKERIFEIFYSKRKGGTGLGLAVVERIVKAHGGYLEFETGAGEGSVFRALIPPSPAPAE